MRGWLLSATAFSIASAWNLKTRSRMPRSASVGESRSTHTAPCPDRRSFAMSSSDEVSTARSPGRQTIAFNIESVSTQHFDAVLDRRLALLDEVRVREVLEQLLVQRQRL